jgi:ABC-2 type transport system permease protein
VALVSRAWYNPALRSPNALLPGIVAIVMMVIAAMLTSVTVAREWETGTMEQLIGTPIRAGELICGKVAPYFVIGMVDVAIAVGMSRWLFGVPLRGQPALLFATAAVFMTGALFFGITLSINLKSQVLANQIALVAGFLPTLILSGFVFAIENMPLALQYLTYIVPARYLITIMRGVFMKGIGLSILWLDALLLVAYALVMIAAARGTLKLRLE